MSDEQDPSLDSWHRRAGGRMVDSPAMRCRSSMKGSWPSISGRASAGLFDVSHMGQLIVAGAGGREGAGERCSRRSRILQGRPARYSLLLNAEGGIIDDLMVTRRGEHFYWSSTAPPRRRHRISRHSCRAASCSII
jgi:aminomethyltransferase